MFSWEEKLGRKPSKISSYLLPSNWSFVLFQSTQESISTCRFAQRVALIKNEALINEELDPKLIILRLKREVDELKNQLAIANNGDGTFDTSDLKQDELEK